MRIAGLSGLGAALVALAPAAASQARPWSFEPIADVEPPAVRDRGWPANPIDAFVLASLEAEGLAPSPEADARDLARRLSLVMHGLPPAPEAVDRFNDEPWERRVDEALASPRYGERWGRHWLDLARFAETNGFETNTPRANAWPYRDWVIEAFNDDVPFDRFALAQIAGDAIGEDAATGFLVAGAYDTVKSPDVALTLAQRQDELADMVNATTTAFLGLTVACARCHDHRFDPIRQEDYYAVQAVLAGVQHGERELRPTDHEERAREAAEVEARLAVLGDELGHLRRAGVGAGRLVVLDDEAPRGVERHVAASGHGINPPGGARGERDDRGDEVRIANLSRGRYTWWDAAPDQVLFSYAPAAAGSFRVWLSWGCGWDTHAMDARYELDLDGDLATTEDRRPLATVDQRAFADGTLDIRRQALWSGLFDAGVHELEPSSRVLLRSGSTAAPVTADVLVLEEVLDPTAAARPPRLRPAVDALGNEEEFEPVEARFVRMRIESTNNGSEPCLDELEVFGSDDPALDLALASGGARAESSSDYAGDPKHRLEHLIDGQYGNGRSWISGTRGTGEVRVELPEARLLSRVRWARDREGVYADRLAVDYAIDVALVEGEWVEVASSRDRYPPGADAGRLAILREVEPDEVARARALLDERDGLEARLAELRAKRSAYAGRFEQPEPTRLLHRGDPQSPRDVVAPGAVAALGSLDLSPDTPEQARRVAFARWLGDPANPLTARVIVNRIWMHHFGEGLVDTPSDFGNMGTRPTHPGLLDWLARELIDSGWSLKHVQRLVLTSRTWRQSSASNERGLATDAASRLLWRFPPRRLEGEVIRDSILAVSGSLDLAMGGPGFEVFEPNDNYVRNYVPRSSWGPDAWRRAVYRRVVRMEPDPVFGSLDLPDAGQVCPERPRSNTPLQALDLFNSPFVTQQAERFAARVEAERIGAAARVQRAFRLALAREPDPIEAAAALELVALHGLPSLCRALYNCNELVFLP